MEKGIFGPVLCIALFHIEQEGIDMANDVSYGLTNYVQTQDRQRIQRVAQELQRGTIYINDSYQDRGPLFGRIKDSGHGYESGQFGFKEYCIIKAVTEYDNNNNNNNNNDDPDEKDKVEEEDWSDDYSDDYSDESDKEEERKMVGMRKSYNLFNWLSYIHSPIPHTGLDIKL